MYHIETRYLNWKSNGLVFCDWFIHYNHKKLTLEEAKKIVKSLPKKIEHCKREYRIVSDELKL